MLDRVQHRAPTDWRLGVAGAVTGRGGRSSVCIRAALDSGLCAALPIALDLSLVSASGSAPRGPLGFSFGHKQHHSTRSPGRTDSAQSNSPHTHPTAPIRCSCTACVSALRWFALPRLAANAHLLRILGILIAHGTPVQRQQLDTAAAAM